MTEQQEDAAAAPQGGSGGKKSRALTRKEIRTRRNVGLAIVALIAGLVALYFLLKWRTVDRHVVQTDNAFVTGNLIPVFADATGVVSRVLAEETQSVKQGELVVQLDAQLATAPGSRKPRRICSAPVRSVGALFENRRRACERILSRVALRDKLKHDYARYQQAAPSGSVSQQVLQNAADTLASAEADVREARADTQSFEAQISGVTRSNHPDILAGRAKYLDAFIEYARQQIKRRPRASSPSARRRSATA